MSHTYVSQILTWKTTQQLFVFYLVLSWPLILADHDNTWRLCEPARAHIHKDLYSERYNHCKKKHVNDVIPHWPSVSWCVPQELCHGSSRWNLRSGTQHGRQSDEQYKPQSTYEASQSAHVAHVYCTASDTSSDLIRSASEQYDTHGRTFNSVQFMQHLQTNIHGLNRMCHNSLRNDDYTTLWNKHYSWLHNMKKHREKRLKKLKVVCSS